MIWLLLRRYWPVVAILAALGAIWVWHIGEVRQARKEGYAKATSEYQAELRKREAGYAKERERSEHDWQTQVADLQRRAITIRPAPIRLCVNAPSVPAESAAAGPDDPARERGHGLQAGPDIGRDLLVYAVECEHYRRQLKAIQDWVR